MELTALQRPARQRRTEEPLPQQGVRMPRQVRPIRRGLELVGRRWVLWLLCELDDRAGARFTDLLSRSAMSRRTLAEELAVMENAGLVRTAIYSRKPRRHEYLLTARGVQAQRAARELRAIAHGVAPSVQRAPSAHTATDASSAVDRHPLDHMLQENPALARDLYAQAFAPLERYDEQYRTQLGDTLRTWLECDASVSATAARMWAHRHTIRYRLDRIRELTGLDVNVLADRERLALGVRAADLISSTRPM